MHELKNDPRDLAYEAGMLYDAMEKKFSLLEQEDILSHLLSLMLTKREIAVNTAHNKFQEAQQDFERLNKLISEFRHESNIVGKG